MKRGNFTLQLICMLVAGVACGTSTAWGQGAQVGACCNMNAQTCNNQKCGTCPWWTCNINSTCTGLIVSECLWQGQYVDVDSACAVFCENSSPADATICTEGGDEDKLSSTDELENNCVEIGVSLPFSVEPSVPADKSKVPFWMIAITALLILPVTPVIARRRR